MRIKLTLAYDGAEFAGWQSQTGGNTIQDSLERALLTIAKRGIRIHGAGRTDAGVHALGQCAHFDAPATSSMEPAHWLRALNANLPPEIRILRAVRARHDFHARFSATGKIYRYEIRLGPVLDPFDAHRAWHVPQPLDLAILSAETRHFIGRHDFASFAANRGKPVRETVRTIRAIALSHHSERLRITFHGDGFLYKMVRLMTGALVRAALGRDQSSWIPTLLASRGASRCTFAAPADGLYLVRVLYSRAPVVQPRR
jgi:tRNA pseudouridine38-40 synthase